MDKPVCKYCPKPGIISGRIRIKDQTTGKYVKSELIWVCFDHQHNCPCGSLCGLKQLCDECANVHLYIDDD